MVKEVTIKELLKKAGVDGARYQELASYLAAHAVYAVELNDNDSESNANQTQTKRNQTQSEEELTMIKTRIYLTSGSHVDVQESFDDVGYAMSHSAPGWTFTLKLENGEPVSLVRDHVAYFTTYEKNEQTLTYREFIKAFNALNHGPHACESSHGGVAIFTRAAVPCQKMASLGLESRVWVFEKEAKIFNYDELTLMAKLATTLPELRGGFNDD